jgi:hypothetical protein
MYNKKNDLINSSRDMLSDAINKALKGQFKEGTYNHQISQHPEYHDAVEHFRQFHFVTSSPKHDPKFGSYSNNDKKDLAEAAKFHMNKYLDHAHNISKDLSFPPALMQHHFEKHQKPIGNELHQYHNDPTAHAKEHLAGISRKMGLNTPEQKKELLDKMVTTNKRRMGNTVKKSRDMLSDAINKATQYSPAAMARYNRKPAAGAGRQPPPPNRNQGQNQQTSKPAPLSTEQKHAKAYAFHMTRSNEHNESLESGDPKYGEAVHEKLYMKHFIMANKHKQAYKDLTGKHLPHIPSDGMMSGNGHFVTHYGDELLKKKTVKKSRADLVKAMVDWSQSTTGKKKVKKSNS